MNNISALNQVFTNLNQNLATLGIRVNSIVDEVERLKAVIKELQQVQETPVEVEPHVSVEEHNALTHEFNVLKNVHGDIVLKINNIENSVENNEKVVKDIEEQVARVKITCDNLLAEGQAQKTTPVTVEDVQSMIDNAINSLIGVLTASSTETGGPLPTIPEILLETIPEDTMNGVAEDEVVDEIQGIVDTDTETTNIGVVVPLEPVSEVQEPTKKKGRGGRKTSTKK
jgi:chaperonin cofactor prefoldin